MELKFKYSRDDFYREIVDALNVRPRPIQQVGQAGQTKPPAIEKMLAQRRLAQNKGR